MKRTILISVVVLLAFSFSLQAAEKGIARVNTDLSKRVALIIGNSNYSANVGPLRNPVNDARTMAEALEGVGFEVTRLENVKYREMREAVRDFGSRLRKSDAALFYFSGHGVQFEGGNYLLPIGAEIEIPQHISYEALSENEVLAEMEGGTKDRVNLVIVDACRNNLVTRGFRSASKGLAQPEFHPSGSLIAYATAPGKVAADGTGANSPYVAELSKHLRTPGLKVEDVFKRVLVGVEERTKGKQVPWVNASLKGDFYFVPPEEKPELATVATLTPTPAPSSAASKFLPDEELWEELKDSDNPEDFEDFLAAFPESKLAPVARIKLKRLKRKQDKAQAEQQQFTEAKLKVEEEQKKQQELAADGPLGTVTDITTGLMWQKEPFEFGLNWHGAVEYCNNLEFGGFSDWTLPFKGDFPGFEEQKQLFPEERRNNRFWTGSNEDSGGSYAYTLDFTPYTYDRDQFSGILEEHYVRCVRGGWGQQETLQPPSGTIVDTSTGLMWQKKPDGIGRNWQNAKWYCEGLTLGGFSGWELPNVEALKNMIGKKELFDHYKMGIESDYWSSTPHMDRTSSAWFVYFKGGGVNYSPKAFENNVRCVRGGLQNQGSMRPKSESTEAQPGTVIDASTGLIWQKKSDGIERNWQKAKWYCEGMRIGGYSDWKLPSRDELEMGFKVKHLFDPFKRQDWDSLYWSSTNDVLLTTHSLRMHFSSAEVSSNTKAGNNYVRCVRGGWGQQESESKQSAWSPAGTVIDSSTGLMWQKKPDGIERNWQNAKWYCEGMTLGGYSDWVLPTKESFPGFEEQKQLFPEERRNNRFWTNSKDAFGENAYTLVFTPITYDRDQFAGILEEHHVRCVRGGKGQQESESESSGVFNKGYFTIGSTKDEVLTIQGQPTHVYESFWMFGSSVVHFEGNRVLRWEDFQANLKVKLK